MNETILSVVLIAIGLMLCLGFVAAMIYRGQQASQRFWGSRGAKALEQNPDLKANLEDSSLNWVAGVFDQTSDEPPDDVPFIFIVVLAVLILLIGLATAGFEPMIAVVYIGVVTPVLAFAFLARKWIARRQQK